MNEYEEWYEREKEKLSLEYLKGLEQKKKPEVLEATFHKKFKSLQSQFQRDSIMKLKFSKVEASTSKVSGIWSKLVNYFR